jgi:hypothetical protein
MDDEDEDAKGARATIPDARMCRTRVKYVPRVRAASNASKSVDFCEQYVRDVQRRVRVLELKGTAAARDGVY